MNCKIWTDFEIPPITVATVCSLCLRCPVNQNMRPTRSYIDSTTVVSLTAKNAYTKANAGKGEEGGPTWLVKLLKGMHDTGNLHTVCCSFLSTTGQGVGRKFRNGSFQGTKEWDSVWILRDVNFFLRIVLILKGANAPSFKTGPIVWSSWFILKYFLHALFLDLIFNFIV